VTTCTASADTTADHPSVALLSAAVDALVVHPADRLTVAELTQRIAGVTPQIDRLDGWVRAAEGELNIRTGGQLPTQDGAPRSVAGWLADVRRDSAAAAGSRLRTAERLRQLPLIADAVLEGLLTPAQAQVLTRLVGQIEPEALLESQESMLLIAARLDPVALGQWVAQQIATHVEPALEAEQDRGHDRRFLQTSREADGSLRGRFLLSREDSEAFLTAVEPLARRTDLSDTRSAGQRRADALVDVCEQVLRTGDLPDSGGHRPQLTYILPAGWAAGQQQRDACTDCGPRCTDHQPISFADSLLGDLPGSVRPASVQACATAAWSGPQTRARIEAILCDARISRMLLDSTGQAELLESLSGAITKVQRRLLAARDLGCTARNCTRPGAFCDAHHLVRRADGGLTTIENLVLLCRRHHVLWHKGKLALRDLRAPWCSGQHPAPPSGAPPRDVLRG
jgi:hypothetical protein